jgi:hypothetical protein
VNELLDHPLFQGGLAPLGVAMVVGFALARTRFAWLAIMPAYATMVALDTGFSLFPPTVARKTMAVGLLAPLVGIVADLYPRLSRRIALVLVIVAALLSLWIFQTALENRTATNAIVAGAGVAVFVAAMVAAVLQLRDDGLRGGAAGVGLGLAASVAGILSASIGALIAGAAIASACGAMLILQIVLSRPLAPGFTGALPVGMLIALIVARTQELALLPWYALPLALIVPLAASMPVPRQSSVIARAAVLVAYALAAAALPIGAAWYAAQTAVK